MLVEEVAKDISNSPPDESIALLKNLFHYDAKPALQRLGKIPIRCVNTDLMPTNVNGNKSLAYSFGITLMPGYGHYPQLEDPNKFNIILDETLFEFFPDKKEGE